MLAVQVLFDSITPFVQLLVIQLKQPLLAEKLRENYKENVGPIKTFAKGWNEGWPLTWKLKCQWRCLHSSDYLDVLLWLRLVQNLKSQRGWPGLCSRSESLLSQALDTVSSGKGNSKWDLHICLSPICNLSSHLSHMICQNWSEMKEDINCKAFLQEGYVPVIKPKC